MLEIYLARHGQNEDNKNGILNGHRDLPLTQEGRDQARALAQHIALSNIKFDAIYTSPLVRAYETAEIVANTLSAPRPISKPVLIERNFGGMMGKKISDIEKMCSPHILQANPITYFLEYEGAETFPDLVLRARNAIAFLEAQHTDGKILVVGHGDFGKMMYAAYYDLDWKEVLTLFHFGNSELILLSRDSSPHDVHVFQQEQYNH